MHEPRIVESESTQNQDQGATFRQARDYFCRLLLTVVKRGVSDEGKMGVCRH